MLDVASLALLAALPVLLTASGFFSGSETALFSLTRHQRKQMARSTHASARAVVALASETRPLLITLLMGNMTINVLYFVLSSALVLRLGEAGLGPAALAGLSVASLLGIVLLGEVLPKIVAAKLARGWSTLAAPPLLAFHKAASPIRWFANHAVVSPLARLMTPPQRTAHLDADEIASMLDLSHEHGVIDPGEQTLLDRVLQLGDLRVRQIMKPRVDIRSHDLSDPPEQLIDLFRETRLRQVPITDNGLDQVVGVAYAKQALLRPPQSRPDVEALARQVRFVPEQQRADALLVELRKSGSTVAIVVNEYGGTAGLVTLEDVVEQIVGDIPGEFEPAGAPSSTPLGPNRWRIDAGLGIRGWAQMFGVDPAAVAAANAGLAANTVDTVGGLVMAALGRAPEVDDTVRIANVELRVASMDGRRITEIELTLAPENETDATPAASASPTQTERDDP
ncbi:MAG: hemolysin family protein [Planctomycetota bacterium]